MDHAEALEKAYEVTIAGFRIDGTTTQKPFDEVETPEKALEPPVSLEALAKLSQISGVRSSIIDAIARNTVGLGYSVDVARGREEKVGDARSTIDEVTQVLEALAHRDLRLDNSGLTELLLAVKTDEEEVGWGFIEVSRSKLTGRIDGIFHVPGKLMRRLKDRSGYVLLDPNGEKNTDFYNFGEKVKDDSNGEATGELEQGKSWATNEVICFRLYTSESRDYGMPRDVALALEYAGDKLAAEYNVSFFDSGGTPPTVLFVSSGQDTDLGTVKFKVPQETVARIANTIKSDGGHRDRVAIIPLPPNSKVDRVQLGEISDRDMGFVKYRQDNAERILSAFRVQPIFIGLGSEGRYDAEVQRALTLEQVFDPEQDRYENRIHDTILRDMGYDDYRLTFKRMAVESDQARRDSAVSMAEGGAITRREYRAAFGYGPLPEAAEGATPKAGQYEHGWNDKVVDTGTPKGANNRSITDQRGLKPGLADRQQQSTDAELAAQAKESVGQLRSLTGQSA
jgi:capsid portal protein